MRLTELADVLRTVVVVKEWSGRNRAGQLVSWKEMSRSLEYVGFPTHIMNHHTASKTTITNDVNYCNVTSTIRPLANVLVDRTGVANVCAAGPTNTNGSGHDWWGGGVLDNRMNEVAIGIEICNDGVGEPYSDEQQQAVLLINAVLAWQYKIPSHHCRAHFEWTNRKIDPSGPSRWSPNGGKWNMDVFRADVENKIHPPVGQPPIPGEEIMAKFIATPPPEAGAGAPWLFQEGGDTTYCSTETYNQEVAKGTKVVPHNVEQYHWLKKAAGLG